MELRESVYTVVVANDDEDGLQVRDLACQWQSQGLLGEFGWVTPGDVHCPDYGPATIMATVVGKDEPVELMTLLGVRPRTLIRIVLLHLMTHEHSSAQRLVEACDQISDLVSRAMPRRVNVDRGIEGMRLLRINLMVPESDLLPQDVGLIEPGWEVNAIVSPEDRPDLDRMSVFVRKSANLHGHGLAAAAAVGGLWSDASVGAFDHHQTDSTTSGREVLVIRCQARIVVGDDRSHELADEVVASVQTSDMGAAPLVTWGVPADNPEAVVRGALIKLLQHPEWAPLERSPEQLEKLQVSLGALLTNWALFQVQLPAATARYVFGLGRSVVERSVTAATVGLQAGEVGRVRPLTPDQARTVAEFRMRELADQLEPARLHDEASSWGQTTPAAWRELRELAIGLVDGSRLPDRYSRTTRGGLDEVLAPSHVVPHPADVLELVGRPTLSGVDIERFAEASMDLEEMDGGAGEDPPSGGAESQPAEDGPKGPEAPVQLSKTVLAAWVETRKDTLMWLLASRVHEFKRRESDQVEVSEAALKSTGVPSTDALRRGEAFVVLSWAGTALAVIFAGLWVWGSIREDPIAFVTTRLPDLNWENISRLILLVLGILLVAGTNYFQALRAYEWQVTRRMQHIRNASDEFVISRQQEKRWALMSQGVQDWGRIMAELLHRPWADSTTDEAEVGEFIGLPAAVAVAAPVNGDAAADPRTVTRGVEAACARGWLSAEFERVVSLSVSNDPDAQPHAGDLPADLDLGLRAVGARAELVQVAGLESTKAMAKQNLVEDLSVLVSEGDVTMPPQKVVRLGPYSGGDCVDDRDFLCESNNIECRLTPELFHASALVARFNIPERAVFCLPPTVQAPEVKGAEVNQGGVTAAIRVDISTTMQADSIQLFQGAIRRDEGPIGSPDSFN